MKPKHQRLIFVILSIGLFSAAVLLTMQAFRENLVFFYSPSDLQNITLSQGQKIRLGGLVENGSLKQDKQSMVHFAVTDGTRSINVSYNGLLPNLFREGQGVVAEGYLKDENHFDAVNILAKHDENYMPKEVVDSLKRSGHWHDR